MKKIYFDKGNEMERGKGEMMKGGREGSEKISNKGRMKYTRDTAS